ncbi:thiosulfate transporter TsuA-like [Antedon mediterranea]|uniref:thiosulfate transporter TsuA-like n=1 Tax=Antedon mediterranea TaxID=105859 RepID=UPI003AF4B10D
MPPESTLIEARKGRPVHDANANVTKEVEELDELFSEKTNDNHGVVEALPQKDETEFDISSIVKLLICAIAGILDGLAMEKGRVFEPSVIRHQFEFRSFVMMKMFLAAVSSGLLCLALMSILPSTSQRFQLARNSFIERFQLKGYLSSAIGGALLGSGMMIAGGCPAGVLVQVGAGISSSVVTFMGCLFGAFLYGVSEPIITSLTKPTEPLKHKTFDGATNRRYFNLAVPFGLALIPLIAILDFAIPWTQEVSTDVTSESGIFTSRAWAPYYAGALIGSLQVPMVLFVSENLGGSSSYCTMASWTLPGDLLKQISPYLYRMRTGFKNWGMATYVTTTVVGALLSSVLAGSFGTTAGVSLHHAFIGGYTMIFGARLAGGCTSGHGLSGMGNLLLLSFAAIPAMFVGGSLTAAYMHMMNII